MADLLADASVLIDFLNGDERAGVYFREHPSSQMFLHPAVEAEVLVGAADRAQLRWLEGRLAGFKRLDAVATDFHHCIAFVRRYTLSHGIGWPDCLIAATALRVGLPVLTLNDRHFRVIRGLKVVRPY